MVPAPRQDKDAFIVALKNIIEENKIDLLIPTCEEVFHVAMRREEFPGTVFTEFIAKLDLLHNKWEFVLTAADHGLSMPETMLVKTMDGLFHAYTNWKELVFKPIYSRFATRTQILAAIQTGFFHADSSFELRVGGTSLHARDGDLHLQRLSQWKDRRAHCVSVHIYCGAGSGDRFPARGSSRHI